MSNEEIKARIEENESILKMAELHMDNRACLVLRRRIEILTEHLSAPHPPVQSKYGEQHRHKPEKCYAKETNQGAENCVFPACHCGLVQSVEEVLKKHFIGVDEKIKDRWLEAMSYDTTKAILSAMEEYASLKTKELREALEEIEKSLYIGDDLNDKEILHFYVEVVKTIKKEIHKALNNNQ